MQMYTFVRFSVVILETPSKKAAVILSHLYVIGLKIVLRDLTLITIQNTILFLKLGYKSSLIRSALYGIGTTVKTYFESTIKLVRIIAETG